MAVMDSISAHTIIQFSEEVDVRMQQKTSRLKPYVKMQEIKGKFATYDGVGTVELEELTGRNAPIEFFDMEHWRRKISRTRFGATLPIDRTDVEKMLTDPSGKYAEALANAAARRMDRVIIDAMFADVVTGEDLDTTVTYANDGGLTVDATSGLTYEKLLEIHQNFIDNDVNNEQDVRLCMGITGDENTDLMSELELTSGDYSKEYVIDKGKITMATGIDIIRFAANGAGGASPMLSVSGGTRTSFCMAEGAMAVGVARSWNIDYAKRNDMYDTSQIVITGVLGAVRTQGVLIQKVTTTD